MSNVNSMLKVLEKPTVDSLINDMKTGIGYDKKKKALQPNVIKIKQPKRLPDAVVLIQFEVSCKRCKEKFIYSNKYLLLRYDKNIIRPLDIWLDSFSNIERETLVRKETVEACENCFQDGRFSSWIKKRE